jgi:hypothetical protein
MHAVTLSKESKATWCDVTQRVKHNVSRFEPTAHIQRMQVLQAANDLGGIESARVGIKLPDFLYMV